MTDKEKVIKGIDCCIPLAPKCGECPYEEQRLRWAVDMGANENCMCMLMEDAITLLNGQASKGAGT